MKRNCLFFTIILLFASTYTAHSLEIERVFRPARVTRGNTNVIRIQPIDEAAWLWISGDNGLTEKGDETPHSKSVAKGKVKFLKFKNEFACGGIEIKLAGTWCLTIYLNSRRNQIVSCTHDICKSKIISTLDEI